MFSQTNQVLWLQWRSLLHEVFNHLEVEVSPEGKWTHLRSLVRLYIQAHPHDDSKWLFCLGKSSIAQEQYSETGLLSIGLKIGSCITRHNHITDQNPHNLKPAGRQFPSRP